MGVGIETIFDIGREDIEVQDVKIVAGKCSHMDIAYCDDCPYDCDFKVVNQTDN